ncbi:unnamed protein product [Cuscuta epithymum]|uniref:Uncharacterized protein n=1 Tax=Cuscuta epithymum TaxID=186058 RepID=A0AAV0DAE3_9ASTE|nr:unnamed protein product [Cuscuta epithymum]
MADDRSTTKAEQDRNKEESEMEWDRVCVSNSKAFLETPTLRKSFSERHSSAKISDEAEEGTKVSGTISPTAKVKDLRYRYMHWKMEMARNLNTNQCYLIKFYILTSY